MPNQSPKIAKLKLDAGSLQAPHLVAHLSLETGTVSFGVELTGAQTDISPGETKIVHIPESQAQILAMMYGARSSR